MLNMFNLISIDKMPLEQLRQTGIKNIPALVLTDSNGNTQMCHEGKDAFIWLNNFIQCRRQNLSLMKQTENNRKKIVQANVAVNKDNIGGITNEDNRMSDNYSFVVNDLVDYVQPKTFMPYGNDNNYNIVTFNDDRKDKITERDMKQKINEYSKSREQIDKQINNMIDTQLKDTLVHKIQDGNNFN